MSNQEFIQPDRWEIGRKYYLRLNKNGSGVSYQAVKLMSYRPHPAELIIYDGEKKRMVHRRVLFLKESS